MMAIENTACPLSILEDVLKLLIPLANGKSNRRRPEERPDRSQSSLLLLQTHEAPFRAAMTASMQISCRKGQQKVLTSRRRSSNISYVQ
jgi:hypothetical protein